MSNIGVGTFTLRPIRPTEPTIASSSKGLPASKSACIEPRAPIGRAAIRSIASWTSSSPKATPEAVATSATSWMANLNIEAPSGYSMRSLGLSRAALAIPFAGELYRSFDHRTLEISSEISAMMFAFKKASWTAMARWLRSPFDSPKTTRGIGLCCLTTPGETTLLIT